MYLKSIHNVNVGPIKDAKIIFPFNEDKLPKPVVIVGENGTGKSVLLSNVVDSLHEIARSVFQDVVKKDTVSTRYQFYKAVTGQEIHIGQDYMYSYIQYEHEDLLSDGSVSSKLMEYLFKGGKFSSKKFCDGEGIDSKSFQFDEKGDNKQIKVEKHVVETAFKQDAVCYFPPNRYEKPNWLGIRYYDVEKYEHPSVKEKFSEMLDKPIIISDMTKDTLQWLLDVIADSRCDVEYVGNNHWNIIHSNTSNLQLLNVARKNIERIMSDILGEEIYFGLNYRNTYGARFNINSANGDVLIPTLDALSTGQSALFNMFATIVRYAESDDLNKSIRLKDITGIVVIDEIELHLHSTLQSYVLPRLLKLFPKVQFVISTHSPLFLLGMDELYKENGYEIYEMPTATKITVERFSEFKIAYKFFSETETYQRDIRKVIFQSQEVPLVITEGATDWKHMKAAFRNLMTKTEYQDYVDMKFEFLEYGGNDKKLEMGDKKLESLIPYFSSFKHSKKIIFIADNDVEEICDRLGNKSSPFYKYHGNNVFSFVLPVPKHRKNTPEICIEHYYTDEEIKTPVTIADGSERRLYMGYEFQKNGISFDRKLTCNKKDSCGKESIKIIDGNSKAKVYSIDDENSTVNLALPKMDFAEGVLNQSPEFANFNFDSFHLIFDIIKQILDKPNV